MTVKLTYFNHLPLEVTIAYNIIRVHLQEGNVPVPVSTCPGVDLPFAPFARFDNCESFADDTVQVSWTVDNTNTSSEVDFRICSCLPPTGLETF